MSKHEVKLPEIDVLRNELLKFEIDKTHQALFEAGKLLGTSFLTYLSLLCLTVLLVYGKNVEDSVSVPLLALKVSRGLAAAVTLLLCYVVQIWLISLLVLTTSLSDLLCSQLIDRYQRSTFESWYMQYPSPFQSVQFLINILPGKQSTLVLWVTYIAYSVISAFLPFYLSYIIGKTPNFPAALKTPWAVTITILNSSVIIAMFGALTYMRKGKQLTAPGKN
ncbi:MAG TPA: hypothetical protein VHE60_04195 [Pyrinomonadaceae bacterium]|nr:hypothetical protein [Pyrinomonadaceae bacterium]